jgi:hypothetical protein
MWRGIVRRVDVAFSQEVDGGGKALLGSIGVHDGTNVPSRGLPMIWSQEFPGSMSCVAVDSHEEALSLLENGSPLAIFGIRLLRLSGADISLMGRDLLVRHTRPLSSIPLPAYRPPHSIEPIWVGQREVSCRLDGYRRE